MTYTDGALEAAARLARRHLRDLRLPDSAIDVLDEAGAMLRLNPPEDGRRIVDVAEVERVVARMARIPETQATSSDRERLRTLGEALQAGGLRPGGGGGDGGLGHQARPRRARAAGAAGRRLPLHRAHRRGEDGAGPAAGPPPRERVPSLRHVRVHGEALRVPADRRPPGLRGLRAGRAAGGRGAPAPLLGGAPRRDREGPPRPDEHPAPGHGPRDPDRQHRAQGGLPAGRS